VTEKYISGAAKKLYIVCNATHCKHVVGNYKAHHGILFVSLMRNDLFDLIKECDLIGHLFCMKKIAVAAEI